MTIDDDYVMENDGEEVKKKKTYVRRILEYLRNTKMVKYVWPADRRRAVPSVADMFIYFVRTDKPVVESAAGSAPRD